MHIAGFFIHGDPRPQERPRATIRGKRAAVYNRECPWRQTVAHALQAFDLPHFFPEGVPVAMHLRFYLSRPKSHYGTGRNSGTLKPSAPVMPITGGTGAKKRGMIGDVDNYAKAVLDEMNGVVFHDDAQVIQLRVTKQYADGRPPGVWFTLREYGRSTLV